MICDYKLPKQDIIQLCQTLVQTSSVNGVHAEREVAELVAQFAKDHDLEVKMIGREPDRPNVLVKVGPDGEAGLLLVAHTDTVSPGTEENWTYPPFGAEIVGGRLYGRGAADNKGGLVAALSALLMLKENSHKDLRRPVLLACVPDEESGAMGELGVKYLKELGKLSGYGAIYTYADPGMHRIIIGHRGVLRMKIITHGRALHAGSSQWQNELIGYNAVTGMAEIVFALERLRFNERSNKGPFDNFRTVITPTLIQGGTDRSIVPDYCEAVIDIRLVPSVSGAEVEDKIREVVAEIVKRRAPLRVDIIPDIFVPPTLVSQGSRIVSALRKSVKQVLGEDPAVMVSGPANESYILNGLGIPTCVFGPDGGNAHAADEYVVIDSIFKVAAIYALTALMMSGTVPVGDVPGG